jgi:hypothetical protein
MNKSTSIGTLARKGAVLPPFTRVIVLTCGHDALYTRPYPRSGENAYCRTCRDWTTVDDDSADIVHRPSRRPLTLAA